jgi:hypothetical protein
MHTPMRSTNPAARAPVALLIVAAAMAAQPPDGNAAEAVPLKEATMIIEYNASAEDIGIQFFLDSDGWSMVEIRDPAGMLIFASKTKNSISLQGGGTELFLESVEPAIDELPFEAFFERFPEGIYRFRAGKGDGTWQRGPVEFSHDIPAGPVLVTPVPAADADCADAVTLPVVIAWDPVTHSIFGEPLEIVRYELIVENDDLNFDVKFPAGTGTELTVSPELLQPGTEYIFEVLAVEAGGNQTITEGCFTTAP